LFSFWADVRFELILVSDSRSIEVLNLRFR
jgi:hypothetical protein